MPDPNIDFLFFGQEKSVHMGEGTLLRDFPGQWEQWYLVSKIKPLGSICLQDK